MILHQDYLIALDYDPGTDVLQARLSDVTPFGYAHLDNSMHLVVEHVRSYFIKRLLLDTSLTQADYLHREPYRQILEQFQRDLAPTPLERLARVSSPGASYTQWEILLPTGNPLKPDVECRMFADRNEAFRWLLR